MDGIFDENIHPCKGCEDYIPPNGCRSNGGCGRQEEKATTTLDNMRILTAIDQIQRLCAGRDDCDGCPLLLDVEDGTIWKTHRECAVEGRAPEDWKLQELMEKMLEEVKA